MTEYKIAMLTTADIEPYVEHNERHFAEGHDEEIPYGPYGRGHTEPRDSARKKAEERWTTSLSEPSWRRVFALWSGDTIVGTVSLAGGDMPATVHRANLGLGLERAHRQKGYGRKLMETAIAWAREQPTISWIDLGVFGGNDVAERLYRKLGFEIVGVTEDLFRVDGKKIDNTQMTLSVERVSSSRVY